MQTFNGKLQIQYGVPGPYKFEVDLSGEGIVPDIVLEKPLFNLTESCYTIVFQPTLVGKTLTQTISFKNIGIIPCQVIAEVCESNEDAFTLLPHDKTKPFLKVWEEGETNPILRFFSRASNLSVISTTAHTNIVNLKLSQVAGFELEFKPTKTGEFSCLVKLHIINNPFETFMVRLFLKFAQIVKLRVLV